LSAKSKKKIKKLSENPINITGCLNIMMSHYTSKMYSSSDSDGVTSKKPATKNQAEKMLYKRNFLVLADFVLSLDLNSKFRGFIIRTVDLSIGTSARAIQQFNQELATTLDLANKKTTDELREQIKRQYQCINELEAQQSWTRRFANFLDCRYQSSGIGSIYDADLIELKKTTKDLDEVDLGSTSNLEQCIEQTPHALESMKARFQLELPEFAEWIKDRVGVKISIDKNGKFQGSFKEFYDELMQLIDVRESFEEKYNKVCSVNPSTFWEAFSKVFKGCDWKPEKMKKVFDIMLNGTDLPGIDYEVAVKTFANLDYNWEVTFDALKTLSSHIMSGKSTFPKNIEAKIDDNVQEDSKAIVLEKKEMEEKKQVE
jgi:hypothetical protein